MTRRKFMCLVQNNFVFKGLDVQVSGPVTCYSVWRIVIVMYQYLGHSCKCWAACNCISKQRNSQPNVFRDDLHFRYS